MTFAPECGQLASARVTIAFGVEGELVTVYGIFYGGQDFDAAFE
jgi:hypothetical protein